MMNSWANAPRRCKRGARRDRGIRTRRAPAASPPAKRSRRDIEPREAAAIEAAEAAIVEAEQHQEADLRQHAPEAAQLLKAAKHGDLSQVGAQTAAAVRAAP